MILAVVVMVVVHQDVMATQFDVVPHIVRCQLMHTADVLARARRHTYTDTPRLAFPPWIQKEHFTTGTKILTL